MKEMIITTSEGVEGREVIKTLGLVQGSTIQARHVGKDIRAGLKSIVGGEITDYTGMMSDAREEAIRRMTSMPATRLGLQDRGIIRAGMKADITIFDFGTLRDTATFSDPHQYPEGIYYVIVNGEITIENEKHLGALAGEILTR